MPRNSKRRSWTPSDVRTLKTLSRKKLARRALPERSNELKGLPGRRPSVWGYHSIHAPEVRLATPLKGLAPGGAFLIARGALCASFSTNYSLGDCLPRGGSVRQKVHDAATSLPRMECWTANVIIVRFRMRILKGHAYARCSIHCKN